MALPVSRGGIDYPDFHGSKMLGDSSGDVALSELAVRINSGINYSRAGNIVFLDNFDKGISNWEKIGGNPDSVPVLVTNPVDNGYYAVSLQYTPEVNWSSQICTYIAIPASGAFGITFSFNNLTKINEFYIYYYLITLASSLTMQFKFSTTDNIVWLKDNDDVWRNIGKYYISWADVSIYHHWKVLVIPSENMIRYVTINEKVFDTSGVVIKHGGGSSYGQLYINYKISGSSTDLDQMFIDNVYVSANEEG